MNRFRNKLPPGAGTSCPHIKLAIVLLLFGLAFNAQAAKWAAIESEHFSVLHNEEKKAAQRIQRIAEEFYPKVTSDIGYSPKKKISIWFCKTQREFNMAVNAPIQDWAAGCAYPQQHRVVVRDPAYMRNKQLSLSRLVKHEITHVVFGLKVGKNVRNVPRWFNEGLAMYEAEEWSYGQYWAMLTGSLGNSLIPLYQIADDFPQDEHGARMAYAQSYSIITFIANEYGEDAIKQSVRLIAEGRDIDEALAGAIGIDSAWLERKWLKSIRKRYKWISLVTSWVVIWTFIILILILAYWRLKVKSRRIVREWEEEDLFWGIDEDEEAE